MDTWIYFIHPPREDFAETMTEAEDEAWGRHWERIQRLFDEGRIVLVGPTLGRTNTGLCVFEAPDEAAARAFMNDDPTIAEGFAPRRAAPVPGLAAPRPRRGADPRGARGRAAGARRQGTLAAPRAGARTRRGSGP